MPRQRKDDFSAGLEVILNNPETSFMKNPKTFREIQAQSGMPVSAMIRHIGKTSKQRKVEKPTDEERSKERLETLEANSEKK